MYRKDKKTQKDNKNKRDKKDKQDEQYMYDRREIYQVRQNKREIRKISRIEERYIQIKCENW